MNLPEEPMMLYSFINMKLRDSYPTLDALCEDMNVEKAEILRRLQMVGFEYDPERNRFWQTIEFTVESSKKRVHL